MSSLAILLGCILFIICMAMLVVRLVVGTIKLLYKIAPIVVFLGLAAMGLLCANHCNGSVGDKDDARDTRSAQTQSDGDTY